MVPWSRRSTPTFLLSLFGSPSWLQPHFEPAMLLLPAVLICSYSRLLLRVSKHKESRLKKMADHRYEEGAVVLLAPEAELYIQELKTNSIKDIGSPK